mmetsp:Transcript_4246/g.9484  ORF Transcript_4246/g.9484 Transcript_4246/m.9484 type:complete len:233 (-) Transcript_4246:1559-2257(-)
MMDEMRIVKIRKDLMKGVLLPIWMRMSPSTTTMTTRRKKSTRHVVSESVWKRRWLKWTAAVTNRTTALMTIARPSRRTNSRHSPQRPRSWKTQLLILHVRTCVMDSLIYMRWKHSRMKRRSTCLIWRTGMKFQWRIRRGMGVGIAMTTWNVERRRKRRLYCLMSGIEWVEIRIQMEERVMMSRKMDLQNDSRLLLHEGRSIAPMMRSMHCTSCMVNVRMMSSVIIVTMIWPS